MSQRAWHAAGAGTGVLVGAAAAVITNVVTSRWSVAWGFALAALTITLVAIEVLRSLYTNPNIDPQAGGVARVAFAGRHLVLSLLIVALVAVFALIWIVPREDREQAATSCGRSEYKPIPALAFRCEMVRWRSGGDGKEYIPVYAEMRSGKELGRLSKDVVDRPLFVCEAPGNSVSDDFGSRKVTTTYWALTLTDREPDAVVAWGFVPEFYFEDGGTGQPDDALPECTPDQVTLGGTPYRP